MTSSVTHIINFSHCGQTVFLKKSQDGIYFSSSTSGPRTLVVAMVHFLKCQKLTYDKFRFFMLAASSFCNCCLLFSYQSHFSFYWCYFCQSLDILKVQAGLYLSIFIQKDGMLLVYIYVFHCKLVNFTQIFFCSCMQS